MLVNCHMWCHEKGRMRGEVEKETPKKVIEFYDVTCDISAAF